MVNRRSQVLQASLRMLTRWCSNVWSSQRVRPDRGTAANRGLQPDRDCHCYGDCARGHDAVDIVRRSPVAREKRWLCGCRLRRLRDRCPDELGHPRRSSRRVRCEGTQDGSRGILLLTNGVGAVSEAALFPRMKFPSAALRQSVAVPACVATCFTRTASNDEHRDGKPREGSAPGLGRVAFLLIPRVPHGYGSGHEQLGLRKDGLARQPSRSSRRHTCCRWRTGNEAAAPPRGGRR